MLRKPITYNIKKRVSTQRTKVSSNNFIKNQFSNPPKNYKKRLTILKIRAWTYLNRGFFCPNVFICDVIYRSRSRTSDMKILSIDLNVWGTRRHFVQLRIERRVKKQPIYVVLMNLPHFFPKSKLWVPTIRAGSNFFFFRCPIMVRPF